MKKKIILLSVLLIPSLIYFFFELTQANFKKMPYYGPKRTSSQNPKDTLYYSLPPMYFSSDGVVSALIDTLNYPLYVIVFIDEASRNDNYKLRGLVEYALLKPKDLKKVPVLMVAAEKNGRHADYTDSLHLKKHNVKQLYCADSLYKQYREQYLKGKPYYIMNHFLILVDNKRHIRGYYDGSFVPEVKRMIEEFEHLKLRDEHSKMEQKDKIERH